MQFNIGLFYNAIDDMIQWLPDESGVWRPRNVRKVTTYGSEIRWKYEFELADQTFNTQLNYAWTKSIDEGNRSANDLCTGTFGRCKLEYRI